MYLIKVCTKNNTGFTIAVALPKELFETISMFDSSEYCVGWYIVDYTPKHFGWCEVSWKKYAPNNTFTRIHFDQIN